MSHIAPVSPTWIPQYAPEKLFVNYTISKVVWGKKDLKN